MGHPKGTPQPESMKLKLREHHRKLRPHVLRIKVNKLRECIQDIEAEIARLESTEVQHA